MFLVRVQTARQAPRVELVVFIVNFLGCIIIIVASKVKLYKI